MNQCSFSSNQNLIRQTRNETVAITSRRRAVHYRPVCSLAGYSRGGLKTETLCSILMSYPSENNRRLVSANNLFDLSKCSSCVSLATTIPNSGIFEADVGFSGRTVLFLLHIFIRSLLLLLQLQMRRRSHGRIEV
jgi:hypothetical protein